MPDNFKFALQFLLKHEGGFVNDVNDSGGATNFGISLYYLKSTGDYDHADLNHDGRIDIEDIKALTPEIAGDFYKRNWWDHYGYYLINNLILASKVFDLSVNMGGIPVNRLLQRATCDCGQLIAADGILGIVSLKAINLIDPNELIANFEARCAERYRYITVEYPKNLKFLKGWLRRVYD